MDDCAEGPERTAPHVFLTQYATLTRPFLTVYHDHAMNHAWVHGWTDVRSELLRHGPWRMGMAMEPDAIFNYVNMHQARSNVACAR